MRELIERLESRLSEAAPSMIARAPDWYKDKMAYVFGSDEYEDVSKVDRFSVGDVNCIGDSSTLYCSGDSRELKQIKSRAEEKGLDTAFIPNQDLLIIYMG